jgi:hypothetical protein
MCEDLETGNRFLFVKLKVSERPVRQGSCSIKGLAVTAVDGRFAVRPLWEGDPVAVVTANTRPTYFSSPGPHASTTFVRRHSSEGFRG